MGRKTNILRWPSVLFLLLLILIPSYSFGFPLRVKDDLNRSVEVPHAPRRIVSLSPSVTEILFVIGVGERVVGVSDHCNYPPEVARIERVGGFAGPDLEKIVGLRPDLVIAFGTIQVPVVHALEQRGVRVFWTYPRSIQEILTSFEQIGEITGVPAAGKRLRDTVEGRISRVQERLEGLHEKERPGIFRVMGLDPLGTVGKLNFQSDLYRAAGGRNVFEDVTEDFFVLDKEELKRRNPDVIVVCGDDPQRLRQSLKDQRGLEGIEATNEDRILVLPCDLICRPGPRVGETIEQVASFLHPEKFTSSPQRIVSLVPALTEELYLLGVGDRVVGVTTYCQRPSGAQNKEKVGTVIDVNLEKVLQLSPDVVFASPLIDQRQMRKLQKLGMKVKVFHEAKDFYGLCENFLKLSRLVDREQRGKEIIGEVTRQLKDVKKQVEGLPHPQVFVQIGANPLFTATKSSFVNDFIEFSGAVNIAVDAKTGIYSREEVIRRNPDVILIVTMGIVGEKEKEVWSKYETINAVKNRRIYIVDSKRVCSPTPMSFVGTVKELVRLFHGVT